MRIFWLFSVTHFVQNVCGSFLVILGDERKKKQYLYWEYLTMFDLLLSPLQWSMFYFVESHFLYYFTARKFNAGQDSTKPNLMRLSTFSLHPEFDLIQIVKCIMRFLQSWASIMDVVHASEFQVQWLKFFLKGSFGTDKLFLMSICCCFSKYAISWFWLWETP